MASADVNSQPKQPPIFWNHLIAMLRSIPRTAVLSMIGPSLLCVAGYFGWLFYGARNLDMAYYGLKKENVHLTDQPPWLRRTSVLDEVFNGGALSRLSLMDVKTPETLVRVFDAHPAIRKTHRVEKMAGGVVIHVEYRLPVAMVRCQFLDDQGQRKDGFLPIDVESVVLDTNNFTSEDVPQFITINVPGDALFTNVIKGKPFGDPRIEEAARLCYGLNPIRESAKISRVNVYGAKQSGKPKSFSKFIQPTTVRVSFGGAVLFLERRDWASL